MIKQKKIISFITIMIATLLFLKIIDYFFYKFYGLGSPILYASSKQFGYKIKPNQNVKRKGNNILINESGMRSSNKWKDENGKFKILFFGDSVTYGGSLVNNNELFSEKICDKLNKNEINYLCGNYGTNGYSIFSIIRRIKYTDLENTNLIVLTLISNNVPRSFHNVLSQPFWSKKIDNFYPALTEIIFIILDKYRNKIKYQLGSEEILSKIDNIYYDDLIEELKITLNEKNVKFIIFYSPSVEERYNPLKNIVFKNKLIKLENFYDLSSINIIKKNEIYYDNIHLNKSGHEIYSNYMSETIKELIKN